MSRDPEEERFARQNSRGYSGWASAFTIAVIVIVREAIFLFWRAPIKPWTAIQFD